MSSNKKKKQPIPPEEDSEKKDELQGWEKCYHFSNTDQMETGLLTIQLLMVSFGLAMLFIRRKEDEKESFFKSCNKLADLKCDFKKFDEFDGKSLFIKQNKVSKTFSNSFL